MSAERNGPDPSRRSALLDAILHPGRRYRQSELYRSVVRHPAPDTPRGRAMTSFHNFFLHVYPVKVSRRTLSFRSTYRLGFIATVLFFVLFVSGMYLMFFYVPSVTEAYLNMHALSTSVAFGQLVRNVHRWSGHLMVLVVFLHLVRVFYSGAYRRPRQFNWVIGVGLLLCTLALSFTGYLLPWDQLAYWAVTVGTNVAGYTPLLGDQVRHLFLGGQDVTGATLLRFYVLHVYLVPGLLVLLLGVHIWRVRKDGFASDDPPGGMEEPKAKAEEKELAHVEG
ncbi:MAG TPA: cytochrome b N-terminal domain-containing protein [Actinomycetota bacterium]